MGVPDRFPVPPLRAPGRAALHHLRRRRLVAASLGTAVAGRARAQPADPPWPQRPIRIVVGFTAGGGVDLAARMLAQTLAEALGQPVQVENRTGANGSLATDTVARAGDGHTLLFGNTGSLAVNNALFPDLASDTLRDVVPVGVLVETPFFLAVSTRLPVNDLAGLVALARARPGQLNFGSNGVGSLHHLAFEQFRRALGLDIAHIPYRGMANAMQDLAGGRLDIVMDAYFTIRTAEEAGHLRILAVTGAERVVIRPELPTVAEAAGIPGYDVASWMALMMPAATPEAVVRRLEASLEAALRPGAPLAEALLRQGLPPRFRDAAGTRALIAAERERYTALIREAGIRPRD